MESYSVGYSGIPQQNRVAFDACLMKKLYCMTVFARPESSSPSLFSCFSILDPSFKILSCCSLSCNGGSKRALQCNSGCILNSLWTKFVQQQNMGFYSQENCKLCIVGWKSPFFSLLKFRFGAGENVPAFVANTKYSGPLGKVFWDGDGSSPNVDVQSILFSKSIVRKRNGWSLGSVSEHLTCLSMYWSRFVAEPLRLSSLDQILSSRFWPFQFVHVYSG